MTRRTTFLSKGFKAETVLFAVFCDHQGPVAVDILSANRTVTVTYYAGTLLPKLTHEFSSQRLNCETQTSHLLHDNASLHNIRAVTPFLKV